MTGFYVLLPLLLYVSILKLSTHNGYVSTQIQIRKAVLQFYGDILKSTIIIDGLTVLTGTGSKLSSKAPVMDASLQAQIIKEMDQSRLAQDEQQHDFVAAFQNFLQNTVFTNKQVPVIVEQAFQAVKNLLGKGSTLGNFLLQELLFRLQDESQQVKKLSAQKLKELIDENYNYIGLVFTDILQMQNQDQFMV